ncbi:MYND-type zinc finger-containing chromatin reader ZMYND8-like isoform X2 [Liolophura sinensis]|uniref:MYND-type zinc finger-containing chromatin reader ZMYND8-like isoform X2 n=1 Tax=Liolophura sinensis TaxID=3198878 RepID=UPI0031587060
MQRKTFRMNGRKMDSSMTTRSKGSQAHNITGAENDEVCGAKRVSRSNSFSSVSSHTSNSETTPTVKSHHRTRSSANSSRSNTPTPPVGKEGRQSNPSTPVTGTHKTKDSKPTPSSGKKRSLASMLEAGDTPTVPPPKLRKIGKNDGTGVNNKNDYFCWMCHREGNVIVCKVCPRVYHTKCLGLQSNQPKDWVCPECEKILRAECVDTRSKSMSMITLDQLCMLLKFALERMQHPTSGPFEKPVDLAAVPLYGDYIYNPMDLGLLEKNIDSRMYGCTEAFLADAKWILHNCIIYNGTHHKLTSSAKLIVKICKHETNEIEICPDCYMNSCLQRNDNWFCEPCRTPHTLVWAKLKGYPFWPAKALREVDGQVDVRFFGAHDRSWVPVSQVFLLSETIPTAFRNKKAGGFDQAMEELQIHIDKIREEFGSYEYAEFRTPYDKNNVYLHNKMKINDKTAAKSAKTLLAKSPKTASSPKTAKQIKASPVQLKGASDAKSGEPKSTAAKTASAVKIKYSSIITTRRAAAAKVAAVDNTPMETESDSVVSSTVGASVTPDSVSVTDKAHNADPIQPKLVPAGSELSVPTRSIVHIPTGSIVPIRSTPASSGKAATTTLPSVLTLKPGDIHRLRIQKIAVAPKLEQALTNMAEKDPGVRLRTGQGLLQSSVMKDKENNVENTQTKSGDELKTVSLSPTLSKAVSSGDVNPHTSDCKNVTSTVCNASMGHVDSAGLVTSERAVSNTNVGVMNSLQGEGGRGLSEKHASSGSGDHKSVLQFKSNVTSNESNVTSKESNANYGVSATGDWARTDIKGSENSACLGKTNENTDSTIGTECKIAASDNSDRIENVKDEFPAQKLEQDTSVRDNSAASVTENREVSDSAIFEDSQSSSVKQSTIDDGTSAGRSTEVSLGGKPGWDQVTTENRTQESSQAQKSAEVSPGKSQYLVGLSKTIESCKAKLGIDGNLDDLPLPLDGASTEEDSEDRSDSEVGSDSDEDLEDPASSTEVDKTTLESTNQKQEKTEQVSGQDTQKDEDSNCDDAGLSMSSQESGTSIAEKMSQGSTSKSTQGSSGDVTGGQSAVCRKRLSEDDDSIPGGKAVNSHVAEESSVKKAKLEESSDKSKVSSARETVVSKCYAENTEDVSETGGLIMEVDTDTDSNNLVIDLDENDVVLTPRKPSAQKDSQVNAAQRSPDVSQDKSCENQGTPSPPKDKHMDSATKSFKASKEAINIATLSSLGVQGAQQLNSCPKKGVGRPRSGCQDVSRSRAIVSGTKTWRPFKVSDPPTTTLENITSVAVSLNTTRTVSSVSSKFVTASSGLTTPTAVATPPVTVTSHSGNVRPTLVSATPTLLTLKGIDGSNQLLKVMSFGNTPRHIAPAPSTQTLPSNAFLVSVPPPLPLIMSPQRKGSQQLAQGQTAVPGTILPPGVTSPCQPQLQTALDLSSVHKINVEKYSEKIAVAVKESVDEMYRDLSSKNTFQTGMKYLQLELEQLKWRHKREIEEIKHNVELTLSEMRKGMETEKHALVEELKKKYEKDVKKAVEKTKKKQWCSNCGKEAIFYCCWNTSYCDYPCQTAHWPQHMDSCTQSQSPEQSAVQTNQSHSTNAQTPQAGKTVPRQGSAISANKEGNSRSTQRDDWVRDNMSSDLLIQQEQNDIGRRGLLSVSANGTSHMRNSSNQILTSNSTLVHGGSANPSPYSGTRQLAGDQTPLPQVGQVMSGQIRQLTQPTMGLTEQMLRGNKGGQLLSQSRQMLQTGQGGQLLQADTLQLQFITQQQGQAPHLQACQIGFPMTNQQGITLLQQRPLMQQNNSMLYPIVSQSSQGQVGHRGPIMFSKNQQQRSPATMDAQNPFQIQNRPF